MSSLTAKKISQEQLIKLLTNLEYENVRATGGHLIFKHKNSKSVIALRHARKNEIVPLFVTASVIRNIIDNNIITEEQLQNEIELIQDKKKEKKTKQQEWETRKAEYEKKRKEWDAKKLEMEHKLKEWEARRLEMKLKLRELEVKKLEQERELERKRKE